MRYRILLINPWIYDFAAYNLWSRPLGLFVLAEFLSAFNVDLSCIDCMDSFSAREYGTGKYYFETVSKPDILKEIPRRYKRYGIRPDEFRARVLSAMPFDAVLMTSVMSYWYPGVQAAIGILKEIAPGVPVALGGIYPTLYPDHAESVSGADVVFKGDADQRLIEILDQCGLKVRKTGDTVPWFMLDCFPVRKFASVQTSSGCPFDCPYCASRLLNSGFSRRDIGEIVREIRELYSLGVEDFAFYDDALLVDSEIHIKPLLKCFGDDLSCRFHTPNGMHARFMDEELAVLMKKAGFQTVRLSLETTNASHQKRLGGKVHNDDLERAVRHLQKAGFGRKQIGVYLMYGLPGQEMDEVRDGIRFLMQLGAGINLAEFSPIKGTRCWDDLVRKGIIPDAMDPLLSNNSVFNTIFSGYDPEEVVEMKRNVKRYNTGGD